MNFDILIAELSLQLAQAIALAEEGNSLTGNELPQRIHNPGDLELGDRGWGVNQSKTIYLKADWDADIEDRTDGCSALRRECTAILTGASLEIPVSYTFMQLATKWTGGDSDGAWCKIVTEKLCVNPLDTIAGWVKAAQNTEEV